MSDSGPAFLRDVVSATKTLLPPGMTAEFVRELLRENQAIRDRVRAAVQLRAERDGYNPITVRYSFDLCPAGR